MTIAFEAGEISKVNGIAFPKEYRQPSGRSNGSRQPIPSDNELTAGEIDAINEIALSSTGSSGAQAKSILEAYYESHFFDCQEMDGTAFFKNSTINPNELGKAYGLDITVNPNPAKDWAAFDYNLPVNETSAILIITDATGKTIETIDLYGQQGQKLWDTRHILAGTYVYTLKSAGFVKTGKIVICK